MIFSLIADFAAALAAMPAEHPRRRILALLDEAIRRDVHFIARHPTTLFQCLWNSAWWYDCPEAEQHYEAEDRPPREAPALAPLLESWRGRKERSTPRSFWLRSVRPPPMPLGAGQHAVLFAGGGVSTVRCVAFSPDGRQIVTGGFDVRIWDAVTGEELRRLRGHRGAVYGVVFAPDGRRVASGAGDKSARLWDAETGAELACLPDLEDEVRSVDFAADGRRVVCAAGHVWVWDTATRRAGRIRAPESPVRCAAFSPDGRLIAGGHLDGAVRVWDAATGAEVRCLRGHTDVVTGVAFANGGRKIVSSSIDNSVRIWDAARGAERCCRPEGAQRDDVLYCMAVSPDGRLIAGGSQDRTVRLWDTATGAEVRCLRGHDQTVLGVAFSPDGRHLASASEEATIRVWDAFASVAPRRLRGQHHPQCVAFSPDGRRLVCASSDPAMVLLDATTGVELWRYGGPGDVPLVAFSPSGDRLVGVLMKMSGPGYYNASDYTLRVWDADSGAELHCIPPPEQGVASLALSPDARRLAAGLRDETLRIWDLAVGGEPRRLLGHDEGVETLVFSPEGGRLLCAFRDRTARLWDAASGAELCRFGDPDGIICAAAFSPDGTRIVTRSYHSAGHRVWDAATGEFLHDGPAARYLADPAGELAWRVRLHDEGTAVEHAPTGLPVAWFPSRFNVSSSGRTWAGRSNTYVLLATLEGGPEADDEGEGEPRV